MSAKVLRRTSFRQQVPVCFLFSFVLAVVPTWGAPAPDLELDIVVPLADPKKVDFRLEPEGFLNKDDFRKKQLAKIVCAKHVQYALWWKPGITKLNCLKGQEKPVEWLQKNLKAEITADNKAINVRWVGRPTTDAEKVLRGVADIYTEDGQDQRHTRKARRIENLESSISGTISTIKQAEDDLAQGKIAQNRIDWTQNSIKIFKIYVKALRKQAESLRRGENPPPVYYKQTGDGPVCVKSPPKPTRPFEKAKRIDEEY